MIWRLLDLLVERRLILWILATGTLVASQRSNNKRSSWMRYKRALFVLAVVVGVVFKWVRAEVFRRGAPPAGPTGDRKNLVARTEKTTPVSPLLTPRLCASTGAASAAPCTPRRTDGADVTLMEPMPSGVATHDAGAGCYTPVHNAAQDGSVSVSPQITLPPWVHGKGGFQSHRHPLAMDDIASSPQPSVGGRSVDRAADVDETCGTSSVDCVQSGSDCDLGDEEEELLAASVSYNAKYQQLMMQMQRPDVSERPRPFLGFSLAESVEDRNLVVDGVYHDGPAYQVGVRIDDELTGIAGDAVSSIQEARKLVARHCRPAMLSNLTFRRPNGETYTVKLWVMTSEPRYRGKPYFFDTDMHEKQQQPPRSSRARGVSLRSFVAAQS